jgi:hypothetical protein
MDLTSSNEIEFWDQSFQDAMKVFDIKEDNFNISQSLVSILVPKAEQIIIICDFEIERDQNSFFYDKTVISVNENAKNYDISEEGVVYSTEKWKLYGLGNGFIKSLIKEGAVDEIELPEELSQNLGVQEIIPIFASDQEDVLFLHVKINDKFEIWSCGESNCHLLGQGESTSDPKVFKPLNYDKLQLNFVKVKTISNYALALTDKGELYSWGKTFEKENIFNHEPKEVEMFKNWIVTDFFLAKDYYLVLSSEKGDVVTALKMVINFASTNCTTKSKNYNLHLGNPIEIPEINCEEVDKLAFVNNFVILTKKVRSKFIN